MKSYYFSFLVLLVAISLLTSCAKDQLEDMEINTATPTELTDNNELTASITEETTTDQPAAASRSTKCHYELRFEKNQHEYYEGDNIAIEVTTDRKEYIEYMDLYVNDVKVKRETGAPYTWDKNKVDLFHNAKYGRYYLKVVAKDICGYYTEKYYEIDVKKKENYCHYELRFEKNQHEYYEGDDIAIKVKTDRKEYIEYMDLYVNDVKVKRETDAPYTWDKNKVDFFHNAKYGRYHLKVIAKDICGDYTEKYYEIEVKKKKH